MVKPFFVLQIFDTGSLAFRVVIAIEWTIVDGIFVTSRIDAASLAFSLARSYYPMHCRRLRCRHRVQNPCWRRENGVFDVEGIRTYMQIFAVSDSLAASTLHWIPHLQKCCRHRGTVRCQGVFYVGIRVRVREQENDSSTSKASMRMSAGGVQLWLLPLDAVS